jgi:hypothetical protein
MTMAMAMDMDWINWIGLDWIGYAYAYGYG